MIELRARADANLVPSIAAVWRSYFDEQSESRAAAIRRWGIATPPPSLWAPFRELLALGVASFLAEVASAPFARVYASALANSPDLRPERSRLDV